MNESAFWNVANEIADDGRRETRGTAFDPDEWRRPTRQELAAEEARR